MTTDNQLMTAKDIAARLGLGIKTIYRLVQIGTLPQPIRLSPKVIRWRRDDFERWLAEQAEQAQAAVENPPAPTVDVSPRAVLTRDILGALARARRTYARRNGHTEGN